MWSTERAPLQVDMFVIVIAHKWNNPFVEIRRNVSFSSEFYNENYSEIQFDDKHLNDVSGCWGVKMVLLCDYN